ncbi:MAG: type II toxin-antitoxin system VapC family toxin [Chloroflexota bacterium]
MPTVCVDASLVLPLFIPEQLSAQARALWRGWVSRTVDRVAPPLLQAEVTSVVRQAVYRGRLQPDEGEAAFQMFCALRIQILESRDLHRQAWQLARRFQQPRAYDAFYLAAAREAGCDLWTGDRRLVNSLRVPWVRWIGDLQA